MEEKNAFWALSMIHRMDSPLSMYAQMIHWMDSLLSMYAQMFLLLTVQQMFEDCIHI